MSKHILFLFTLSVCSLPACLDDAAIDSSDTEAATDTETGSDRFAPAVDEDFELMAPTTPVAGSYPQTDLPTAAPAIGALWGECAHGPNLAYHECEDGLICAAPHSHQEIDEPASICVPRHGECFHPGFAFGSENVLHSFQPVGDTMGCIIPCDTEPGCNALGMICVHEANMCAWPTF